MYHFFFELVFKDFSYAGFPGAETVLFATVQVSFVNSAKNSLLWEMTTTPPSKSLIAPTKAAKESLSKKLVGSSSTIMWGLLHMAAANTTFTF